MRNREFVGDTVNQIVIDPELSTSGQLIIYAALSGPTGGIWRSTDSGQQWSLMLSGNATAVVLDPNSAVQAGGNLQVVYAGFESSSTSGAEAPGVYLSPNQGRDWQLMTGGEGNPLIVNEYNLKNTNPATNPSPNGSGGRIVLAVPSSTDFADQNAIYSGWLYAAVSTPSGGFDGLFVTKDFGENWTQISIDTLQPTGNQGALPYQVALPTNNVGGSNVSNTTVEPYPITLLNQGQLYLTLSVDPTNPNIAYLGSFGSNDFLSDTGLIRVDTTNLWDAHNLTAYSDVPNNGGDTWWNSSGPATVNNNLDLPFVQVGDEFTPEDVTPTDDFAGYLDYIRNPEAPFLSDSTLYVDNLQAVANNGAGVTWIPMDLPNNTNGVAGTGYQAAIAEVDPTTGLPRLIFGNSEGVWSGLDDNGTFETTIGSSDSLPDMNRNGNLSITQFYYGAVQPGNAAAQIAGALFYGAAQDSGGPYSDPNIISNGNLQWSVATNHDPVPSPDEDSTSVGVDQQGLGTVDSYWFPETGGNYTDFFQVNDSGSTFGLLQQSNGLPLVDPQWTLAGITNLAVNPVAGTDILISSDTGNIFASQNTGGTWFDIGEPSVFGSPANASLALAYGAS